VGPPGVGQKKPGQAFGNGEMYLTKKDAASIISS
jgi:hypothetical protein